MTRARLLVLGAGGLVAILLFAILAFELVFVGSGSYRETLRYHPGGTIQEWGRTSWTGNEGVWMSWTPDGRWDREGSGCFHVGFRYRSVDEAEARKLTSGIPRLRIDLSTLAGWTNSGIGARGGVYPDSLDTLIAEHVCTDALCGSQSVLKDPWGREYRYEADPKAHAFTVFSYGRDGVRGGSGEDADQAIVSEWGGCRFSEAAP